jgi:hypothetical protein
MLGHVVDVWPGLKEILALQRVRDFQHQRIGVILAMQARKRLPTRKVGLPNTRCSSTPQWSLSAGADCPPSTHTSADFQSPLVEAFHADPFGLASCPREFFIVVQMKKV